MYLHVRVIYQREQLLFQKLKVENRSNFDAAMNDDEDVSETLVKTQQNAVAMTTFEQNAAPTDCNEIASKNDTVNATSLIINGHHNGRVNTLDRPRVTITEPGLNSFRSGCNSGAENHRRFDPNSELVVNGQFGNPVEVSHRHPHPQQISMRYDVSEEHFNGRENQNCAIPGSHERPPPPRYRRSDYIVTDNRRDFDETRRIMTLDRRRMGVGPGYDDDRIRTGDATMSRQVKYCSVLNKTNGGSVVVDGGHMFPGRRYVAQNGARRDELWLV